jgi:hypothetical protein
MATVLQEVLAGVQVQNLQVGGSVLAVAGSWGVVVVLVAAKVLHCPVTVPKVKEELVMLLGSLA